MSTNKNPADGGLDLERLIAEDNADRAGQKDHIQEGLKKDKRKKRIAIGAAGALAIALIGGFIVYDPFAQNFRFGSSDANAEDSKGSSAVGTVVAGTAEPYEWAKDANGGKLFPVETQAWEEKSYVSDFTEQDQAAKDAKHWGGGLYQASLQLPSEAAGFTSDDSKASNEDGSLNEMYSYWTQEQFYRETSEILERVLNPVYGSWMTYQYSGSMDGAYPVISKLFSDIIAPDTLASGSGMDSVPVYADWNGDDYGMGDQLLKYEEGTRWIGTVNSVDTQFNFNSETEQYDVILTAKVTYSAWTNTGEKVTKDGTLTLNLKANIDKTVESPKKVIIQSSKLEF